MKNKVTAILQARMNSSRFPGKVLADLNGLPMIVRQIQRINHSKEISNLIVAISEDPSDDELAEKLLGFNYEIYRGSQENVFSRFYNIVQMENSSSVVRLTADCPLVMPSIIDQVVRSFKRGSFDYMSNTIRPTYPDGLDVEIFTQRAFFQLAETVLSDEEREHVTLGFQNRSNLFTLKNFEGNPNKSDLRWTVDYLEDLEFVRKIYSNFRGFEATFDLADVLDFLKSNPGLESGISASRRNEALFGSNEGHN
jgi:spore coat polysaccharide biosynthesis protein SpsF